MTDLRQMFRAVGTALAGVVAADTTAAPPADPRLVHRMLTDLGLGGDDDTALRAFQASAGLTVDGFAGPDTTHALVTALRDRRHWDLAA
ncbi:peptidoglycan-binding protein [Longispora sp. K20-0274]|uniref:peptidoglycan-binding protein n=1 Tax=Longispora sp. K20-0274 TaxID=3088255 RepID=UPI00399A73DF